LEDSIIAIFKKGKGFETNEAVYLTFYGKMDLI